MKDDHAIILNKQKLIHEIFRILILFPSKKFDKKIYHKPYNRECLINSLKKNLELKMNMAILF